MSTTKTVADIVRAARKAHNLTQVELAEKVGMSQRWVSDVERGATTMPRLETLQRLVEVLDIDMASLMIAGRWASSLDSANDIARIAEQHRALHESINRGMPSGHRLSDAEPEEFDPLTDDELAELQNVVFAGLNDLSPKQLREILKIVRNQ